MWSGVYQSNKHQHVHKLLHNTAVANVHRASSLCLVVEMREGERLFEMQRDAYF